ncbi:hypothetical protein Ancab_004341 [Ancistrocladus abbreviatus]
MWIGTNNLLAQIVKEPHGWHLCSKCEKNAYYMCYTCTFSLCKGCIRDAVIFCVRGNKGLCETCMKSVMLIEDYE